MVGSLWQRLLDLFRSPRAPYAAGPEPFLRLDREAVRKELQPRERGQAAGAEELPPSDAVRPDSREVTITRFCQDELDRAHEQIRQGIDTLLASIRGTSGTSAEAQIGSLRETGTSRMRSVGRQQRNEIETKLRHATNLEDAFSKFRVQNKRDALPDLSRGGVLSYVALFAMVVAETAANGILFAQGNDFGLLGGFAQAAVFAAANVGLGVVTALAVRQAAHISWWRRGPLALAVILLAALGLLLDLGVAQFRDALVRGTSQTDATRLAVERLVSGSVAPADLVSWLLFAMGYTFFWGACADVIMMRDLYPGYAARYVALLRSREDYTLAISEMHSSLAAIRDQAATRISEIVERGDAWAYHSASLRDRMARLCNSYERHCADIKEFHQQLLEDYRDANRQRRSTPAPSYFSEWTQLDPKPIPTFEPPAASLSLSKTASDAIRDLTAVHDAELQALVPLAEIGTVTHVDSQT